MKRIIILTICLLGILNSYSQITISDYDGLDLTNSTAFLPSDIEYNFQITNNGSSEITFIVEVTAVSLPAEATGFLVCACGTCVGPLTTAPATIGFATALAAGDTYGEEGNTQDELTDVKYLPNGSTDQATITIRVYEEGNESNFAEFTLDTHYTGINDVNINKSVSVYPNPATDNITFIIEEELIGSQIVLTNLLGKIIFSDQLDNTKSNYSVGNFSEGLYFYSLVKDGKIIGTKKLIIK